MRDAGRQWILKIEDSMLKQYGVERAFGVSQLIVKRDASRIVLLVAKATDDLLVVIGKVEDVKHFMRE